MENYTKTNIDSEARVELHEKLGLTGAEVSINQLPAGAGVPFVHAHRNNEEIYGIIAGKGKAVIDGKEIALTAGDWLKVAPAAKRQFSAAADEEATAEAGCTATCCDSDSASEDAGSAATIPASSVVSRADAGTSLASYSTTIFSPFASSAATLTVPSVGSSAITVVFVPPVEVHPARRNDARSTGYICLYIYNPSLLFAQ